MTIAPELALSVLDAGFAVVPPRNDGSKAPASTWREYITEAPDRATVASWYNAGRDGIGVVCGVASGNLEMLELEGRAVEDGMLDQLYERATEMGLDDLLYRVTDAYMEQSPSGGVHVLYRVTEGALGNVKLARRFDDQGKVEVLMETRGAGGYTILAPSAGRTHPSGEGWVVLGGSLEDVVTISAAERDQLHALCATFDQPAPAPPTPPVPARPAGERPARNTPSGEGWFDQVVEEFNRCTTWQDVLTGWSHHHRSGDEDYWTRPGKENRDGASATTNAHGTDRLIVFSSSVTDFETYNGGGLATSYDRFSTYAILTHGGDRTAAARRLRIEGYGPTPARPTPATSTDNDGGQPPTTPPTDWPEPTPLPNQPELTPLPAHVFPPWILEHARSIATQNQVAEDLPALLALGALSAVLNGHVQVQATDGWVEGVNVWINVLAEAGGSKSPVAKAMQAPAREFEKTTIAWAAGDLAKYEQRLALLEKRAKEADDAYLRDGDEAKAKEALKLAADARELVRPPAGEIFAGDVTMEALVDLLARNGEHGAISDTEGTILSIVAGRYSKTTNAEFMLKTWAGDHHDVRRKTGEPFRLEDPHLAVSLTVQPGRWSRILQNDELVEVGFPERFMVSVAPRRVGTRNPDLRRQRLDAQALLTYHDEFIRLAKRCAAWASAARLQLDDDAIDTFDAMRNDHEPRMARTGDLAAHAVFISKLHASVLRTAALLHMAWGHDPQQAVTGHTMAMAVELGSYWLDHYLGPKIDGRALEDAHRILAWVREHEVTTTTAAELNRGMRAFREQGGGDRRSAALLLLQEHGLARPEGEWPLDTSRQGTRIDVGFHPSVTGATAARPGATGATSLPTVSQPPETATQRAEVAPVAPMPLIAKTRPSSSSRASGDATPTVNPGHWRDLDDEPPLEDLPPELYDAITAGHDQHQEPPP